jgi:dienelactone hydrolase
VVYLYGAGGNLVGSGNDLRQIAEMGVAAVGMEYCQTNEAVFDAQFSALLGYLGRQRWADTNRLAWVGFSLGAQRLLSFALRHPERQPNLLVRLAGGWVSELEQFKLQGSRFGVQRSPPGPSTLNSHPSTRVLLIHGEHDEVFPPGEARAVAACLETNGMPVEVRVLAGESHGFGQNRGLVFRVVGEQCLMRLKGGDALEGYRSILPWQAEAWPLWVYWTPAVLWAGAWIWLRRSGAHGTWGIADLQCAVSQSCPLPGEQEPSGAPGLKKGPAEWNKSALRHTANLRYSGKWPLALRGVATLLAIGALAVTALHVVPPRLAAGERTLAIARKHLVPPRERGDFDFLAAQPVWRGKPLKTLLTHVELANYNRQLINWKLDEQVYRDFVLSAQIDPAADGELLSPHPDGGERGGGGGNCGAVSARAGDSG